ncbi:MAG: hypothetical protein ACYS80_16325, partial [Planctomycetota bacterium]
IRCTGLYNAQEEEEMTDYKSAYTTPANVDLQLQKADTGQTQAITTEYGGYLNIVKSYCFQFSKVIQQEIGRSFVPYQEQKTFYFSEIIPRRQFIWNGATYELKLTEDLLGIDSITYMGQALASSTYRPVDVFRDSNGYPYKSILFDPDGLPGYGTDFTDSIVVTGQWGSHDSESDSYSAVGVLAEAIDDSVTTVKVANSTLYNIYDYIKIDDELMFITATDTTPTPDEMTVTRGVNGFTKASHLINAPISRWNVVDDVSLLATRMVAYFYNKRNDKGERVQVINDALVIAQFSKEIAEIARRRHDTKMGVA